MLGLDVQPLRLRYEEHRAVGNRDGDGRPGKRVPADGRGGIALDSQTLYASANGDVVWDRGTTPNVAQIAVQCEHTKRERAPTVSEIEVCGK